MSGITWTYVPDDQVGEELFFKQLPIGAPFFKFNESEAGYAKSKELLGDNVYKNTLDKCETLIKTGPKTAFDIDRCKNQIFNDGDHRVLSIETVEIFRTYED